MRFYGFAHDEIAPPGGLLSLEFDPKHAWALAHRQHFPVDLNRAPREMLLRVPGLGVKTVDRLLQSRRVRRLRAADLARLHVSLKKVLPFVELADHRPGRQLEAALPAAPGGLPAARGSGAAAGRTLRMTPEGTTPAVVTLRSETDADGFRRAARGLLLQHVPPEQVEWSVADGAAPELLFGTVDAGADEIPAADSPRVPAAFVTLCRSVVLHSERQRFALLYRLLWRLQREPGLRHDTLDPDRAKAALMAQAVRREMHKMTAFVRFREVARPEGQAPLHVAWFEPQHHIVDATAPFFMRRFANMPWAILTPERCVRWDGHALQFSPGANRQDAPPADAGEALWLTYYQHIFNPARLKLRMMEKEMPRRYWHNLPEAALISELAADAHARSGGMLAREAVAPRRRIAAVNVDAPASRLPQLPMADDDSQTHATAVALPTAAVAAVPITLHGRNDAWATQRAAAAHCRECPLGALATQTVWGEGPLTAALMLVGEQPGDQEDLQGRPFVGPAGQLLDRALAQLGWDRSIAYVTNAVKHFKYEPRGKRRVHKTPAQREADACQHWMESEIALVQPQALIALGATAARQLLGRPVAVTRERGQWLQRADGLPVLITLHPSALLRADPAEREAGYAAWLADLRHAGRHAAAVAAVPTGA